MKSSPVALRTAGIVCFFFSGFASLIYQTTWLRQIMAFFGASTPTVAATLSIFMAGLCLGSYWGGEWSRRSGARAALVAYLVAEVIIGLGGVFAHPLMECLRRNDGGLHASSVMVRWVLTFGSITAALLPWTLAMGSTYPLFLRFTQERLEFSFGRLYAANVGGAVLGALFTGFVLIEYLGFRGAQWIGVGANAAAAFLALLCLVLAKPVSGGEVSSGRIPEPGGGGGRRLALATFLIGFVSLGYEVVWTRIYTPILGTVVYAFAAMLGVYLAATFLGSVIYRDVVVRGVAVRRLHVWLAPLVVASGILPHWAAALPSLSNPVKLILGIGPFCLLTGFWTPMLVEEYAGGWADRVGRVYAWNGLGCLAGPLAAGFLLLPTLGTRMSLLALTCLLVVPGLLLAGRWRMLACLPLLAAVPVFSRIPSYEEKIGSRWILHDRTATVAARGDGRERQLLVNGVGMTALVNETKWMVHIPAMFHAAPRKILVICFGMGTGFRSALSWGAEVTAVDLVPSVPRMFGYYHRDAERILVNPRARVVIDDGRHFLESTKDRYDLIVVDPPPPLEAAGSSMLNSREFLAAARRALAPGGILLQWTPGGDLLTELAQATVLTEEFPHFIGYRTFGTGPGIFMLASERPLVPPDLNAAIAHAPELAQRDMCEWIGKEGLALELQRILQRRISREEIVAWRMAATPLTDDFPVNEYYWVRRRSPPACWVASIFGPPPVIEHMRQFAHHEVATSSDGLMVADLDFFHYRLAVTLRNHQTALQSICRLAQRHPDLTALGPLVQKAWATVEQDP